MVNKDHVLKVCKYLKENNHGFTILEGYGSKGEMYVVIMVLPRKEVKFIMAEIRKMCDNKVFIVSSDVSKFIGGYGVRKW